ncbi:type II toxin-antitoxin system RelE/ParE family toxin [Nostoc sp. ChiSLP03a]|uniref:type II toxin-antitoxin system RelE family toxin n=1 Tax=Nostoc sp. ChiSLP03a TaxID=3075380 RepID=UPI002AD30602|nr:type II toxin-antitoxin system RelE/ParE family toxin [Nostoc sp. ChiSLP03a]MDZ8215907.1 type II toxin-antitoxin system RelE/ParE family toxin [Nostoc sp. ChiSLP03a]
MTYTVEFSPSARKMFKKLSQYLQDCIQPKIDALAIEPRPSGVKKLKGEDNTYRIRIGIYRVIYEIEDNLLLVTVIKVGGRGDVYND